MEVNIELISKLIVKTQNKSGEIPWYYGGKSDPWNHVEAAMGLCIGGYLKEAFKAFIWLKDLQKNDGSWYSAYIDGICQDKTRETNMSAYIAVGVFQYWLITKDYKFLKLMWGSVSKAIDFVINYQGLGGQFYWAISPKGKIDTKSLLSASSSIFMSLKCAIAIAKELGFKKKKWKNALFRLKEAILYKQTLFDLSKSRFSMDWFYPILCGAISRDYAFIRFKKFWDKFVVNKLGVRCVSDRPWITIAESSELILTLTAVGEVEIASMIFEWISSYVFNDGSFWCGFTFPDITVWPLEKITWTNAVVLMAMDSLYGLTPAGNMFNHLWWKEKYNF